MNQPDPTPRRVVIAEDEVLIRMDLAEMLGEEGYDVVGQAGDGARAVELAEELRPDLVILDVKMPVLDGIAAAEQIAAKRIAPVVILTAFSQRDLVERARDAGAMAYLVKPFSKGDLVPAIEMAVSRFSEIGLLEQEVADLSERLETRKAVDRAKGVLQKELGPQRAGRVPVDPEDRDGPAPEHAAGRRRRRHPRSRSHGPVISSATNTTSDPPDVAWPTPASPRLPRAFRGRVPKENLSEVSIDSPRTSRRTRCGHAAPRAPAGAARTDPRHSGAAPSAAELCVPDDETSCIVGTIRSEEGPVEGIELTVTGGSVEETVTTDEFGKWNVPITEAGEYTVVIDEESFPDGLAAQGPTERTLDVKIGEKQTTYPALFEVRTGAYDETTSKTDLLIQSAFSGLRLGLLLALASVGLSLIYGTTGLSNFAHAEQVTLGGILAYGLCNVAGLGLLLGGAITVVLCALHRLPAGRRHVEAAPASGARPDPDDDRDRSACRWRRSTPSSTSSAPAPRRSWSGPSRPPPSARSR